LGVLFLTFFEEKAQRDKGSKVQRFKGTKVLSKKVQRNKEKPLSL
jgi:hypothetical protein